jgi:hypothetical protein
LHEVSTPLRVEVEDADGRVLEDGAKGLGVGVVRRGGGAGDVLRGGAQQEQQPALTEGNERRVLRDLEATAAQHGEPLEGGRGRRFAEDSRSQRAAVGFGEQRGRQGPLELLAPLTEERRRGAVREGHPLVAVEREHGVAQRVQDRLFAAPHDPKHRFSGRAAALRFRSPRASARRADAPSAEPRGLGARPPAA